MAENKRRAAESSDAGSALRAVLLISAVIMAVLLAVGGIYLIGSRGGGDSGDDNSDGDLHRYFSDLIAEQEDGGDMTEVLVTDMEIDEAFALYSTADAAYYQECTVTFTDEKGTVSSLKKQVLKDGEKYCIRTYSGSALTESVKCDGENILIVNEVTGKSSRLTVSADNSMEDLAGLPSHAAIIPFFEEYRSAEDRSATVLSRCSYSLKRAKAMNSLVLDVTYRDTGISEKYYYYLDYGIIYRCESTLEISGKKTTVYSMETTAFSADITDYVREDSFLTDN